MMSIVRDDPCTSNVSDVFSHSLPSGNSEIKPDGKQVLGHLLTARLVRIQNKKSLTDLDVFKKAINQIATKASLSVVGSAFHLFNTPQAVSGVLLLSESHLAIHTWPEYSTAVLDIFSCSSKEQCMAAMKEAVEVFQCDLYDNIITER